MSTGVEQFQYLLQGLRASFLDDLQERCDHFDNLLLKLEKHPADRAVFDELYRGVHSLKGAGGTHGLHIITSICHQMENGLTDAAHKGDFKAFVEQALKYVDLLRRVEAPGRMENPDYSTIEAGLEALRQSVLRSRKSCLIAESSSMMARVYETALANQPVQFTRVSSGLEALSRLVHEPFDFAIVGRELQELNGIAVMSALRASQGRNQNLPVILVTSSRDNIPEHAHINVVLLKDHHLPEKLIAAMSKL